MTQLVGPSLLGQTSVFSSPSCSFYRLLQVGDEDADDQRVDVDVVHADVRGLGGGLDGLVNGLLAGAVGGAVVRVVGEALGRLVLAGGGAPGHRQQARLVPSRKERKAWLASAHVHTPAHGGGARTGPWREPHRATLALLHLSTGGGLVQQRHSPVHVARPRPPGEGG